MTARAAPEGISDLPPPPLLPGGPLKYPKIFRRPAGGDFPLYIFSLRGKYPPNFSLRGNIKYKQYILGIIEPRRGKFGVSPFVLSLLGAL